MYKNMGEKFEIKNIPDKDQKQKEIYKITSSDLQKAISEQIGSNEKKEFDLLAGIEKVEKTCNNNREEFLKGCSEKFDLQLPYLA